MKAVVSQTLEKVEKKSYPPFKVGDVVRVHRRVKEGNKERVQIVEGEIIAHKHGWEPGGTITLRRVTMGVGVELVLPVYSPQTEKIEIVKRQKVRRAKLYYLRKQRGKKNRLKENREATRKLRTMQEEQKQMEKEAAKAAAAKESEEKKEEGE